MSTRQRLREQLHDVRLDPMDALVAAMVLGTGAYWFALGADWWFRADEWVLGLRGQTAGDFLEPYNGHLSVVYIGIYRVLFGIFGFDHYGVVRITGITAMLSVPALLYLTTRGRIGPPLAALAAISVLWVHEVSLEPGGMNHPLALAASIVCAWCLERSGRRNEVLLAAALAFGLASAGGGVATIVACVVHAVVRGASRARWLAILAPSVAWLVWWYIWSRDVAPPPGQRLTALQVAELVVDGHLAAFESLALGSAVGAWLLLGGFVVIVAAGVRRDGLRGSASVFAWTAASVFWWVALGVSRSFLAVPDTFRYRYVSAVLLILALIPPATRRHRPPRLPPAVGAWARVGVAAWAVVAVVANLDGTRDFAERSRRFGEAARYEASLAGARPALFPPEQRLSFLMGAITQAEYQELVRDHGAPSSDRQELDRVLVDEGAIAVSWERAETGAACERLDDPVDLTAGPDPSVLLRTQGEAVTVAVRRFGESLVEVAELPSRSVARLLVRPDEAMPPWQLHADGACVGSS